ncbi:MAG: phospholipid/cholesterol/gamma-HCH transport system substrate-binding protein [Acidimicrobiaceae bacterium]
MMRTRLCIIVLALVAAGCSLPGRTEGPVKLTAVFDDVGDLVVNHSVQVADVRIGSIDTIELTSDFKAKVTMSVKKDVHLATDAVAELRTTSLLGEKFIALRACDAAQGDTGCAPGARELQSGDEIKKTKAAPELEFVAEQAVDLLGGVVISNGVAPDLQVLIKTGSEAFAGRGPELRGLLEDLSTISATLADQTTNIVTILDGLDKATTTLATNAPELDQLLVNLSQTTTVLADNRQQAVDTLKSLTRLVQAQEDLVFKPYLQQVDRQVKELDAILTEVTQGRQEVGTLLDWIDRFVYKIPKGVQNGFARVYGWFAFCPGPDC